MKKSDFLEENDKLSLKQKKENAIRELKASERAIAVRKARTDLLEFAKLMMPHPDDPEDVLRSRYDVQKHHECIAAALEEVEKGTWQRLIITMPPRGGKLIADSTPVLTPDGWRLHGELKVGDFVFGVDGLPKKILAVSQKDKADIEVGLTNGDVIKVHRNHEWTVFSRAQNKWKTVETNFFINPSRKTKTQRSLTSGNIGKRGGRYLFQLPNIKSIKHEERSLPLHPYALGAWLGDGTSSKCWITHAKSDSGVVKGMEELGYSISNSYTHKITGVVSTVFGTKTPGVPSKFWKAIADLGLKNNKHIPEIYFNSSIEQRLELMAGLIDTDGYVDLETSKVSFSSCSAQLAHDVLRLATELGFRPYARCVAPKTSTSGINGRRTIYEISFQAHLSIPMRLERKKIKRTPKKDRIAIKFVREAERWEFGKCIQVDSEDGLYLVGLNLTPTHNSQLAAKLFIPWIVGRDPYRHVIFASYSDTFSEDTGRAVRDMMKSDQYLQVFPLSTLRPGSASASRVQTTEGGIIACVGAGGAITGRGADFLIIDDPIKDDEVAQSQSERDKQWEWFTKVAMSRLMSAGSRVIIIMTRWHEDDLIGRLTDPQNPCYNEDIAKEFKMLCIPALAEENDPLGRPVGESLWPSRFPKEFLENAKKLNPRGFSALYQGKPTPEDGDFFKREYIKYYNSISDIPKNIRKYAASDHAVSEAQTADKNCFGTIAIDENDDIYILPDLFWERANSEKATEEMLTRMQRHKPIFWWAEKGHISQSIGPFLRKRMRETRTYVAIIEKTPAKDKMTRAQPIQARMSMGKVFFPKFAPWCMNAVYELMKFPFAKHDDFVDWISWIGIGLDLHVRPETSKQEKVKEYKPGTLAWIKEQFKFEKKQAEVKHGGF